MSDELEQEEGKIVRPDPTATPLLSEGFRKVGLSEEVKLLAKDLRNTIDTMQQDLVNNGFEE